MWLNSTLREIASFAEWLPLAGWPRGIPQFCHIEKARLLLLIKEAWPGSRIRAILRHLDLPKCPILAISSPSFPGQ